MKLQDKELYSLHAEFCKTLANPKRLMIMDLIGQEEMSVSELARHLDISLAAVSQHLSVLRNRHAVKTRKDGHTVFYRAVDPRLKEACGLIREVLLDLMKQRGEIALGYVREEK